MARTGACGGSVACRQRYTPEQIIGNLPEAEVALAKGQTVVQVSRGLGITEQTDKSRWMKRLRETSYPGKKN